MIKSLTGFGNVDINDEFKQINIIIRAVNSRYLDIKFRGLDLNPKLEMKIRNKLQKLLFRGSVSVQIFLKNGLNRDDQLSFNRDRYEQIERILRTIQKEYGRRLELSQLISISDLTIGKETGEITDSILFNGITDAIKQVDDMRLSEGKSISVDIKNRIGSIQKNLKNLRKMSVNFVDEQQSKYVNKIKSLLSDIKIDNDRLLQEVAINVDRLDFTEEIVRAESHLEQLTSFLDIDEPVGKKINFILQELLREINTIGSKSPSSEISQIVVELKSEIEKIREQVQNIL